MSAETELYAAISGASNVTALVGTKIYPDQTPQEVNQPGLAYTREETTYLGTIHGGAPLAEVVRFNVYCMADKRSDADLLAARVIEAVRSASFQIENREALPPAEQMRVLATVLTIFRNQPYTAS